MARSTQYIGLNHRAWEFLERQNAQRVATYIGDTGMFSEDLNYGIFQTDTLLPDEQMFVEYTQDCYWSSGPMYFTALKDEETDEPIEETLWREDEM